MKKFTILFALYFIGISIIKAQPIMYRTNGTYGSGIYSLDSLPNSNFVFAIRGGIYPNYHVIIRADSSGNILWQKNTLSSALEQASMPEVVGSKNNIYYTAQLNTTNGTKFTITKFNSQANTLWVKDFQSSGTNFKNATTEDFNGGIIMGGGGCSGNNFLIRIDSSGNFVWKKQYLTNDMSGSAVQVLQKTKDHHFLVASQKQNSQAKHSMLIYKVDTLGNVDWMKELTVDTLSSHIFWPTSIREDNLGNIYVTSLITTPYPELQTLLKLDPNGNLVFFSQVIGADLEFNDVFFDNNNAPIVIGKGYFTRPNKLYGLTIKFDENSGGILDARKIINNETYPDSTICFRKAIKLNSNKSIIAGDYFECYVNILDNSFMQTCISETLNLSVNNYPYHFTSPTVNYQPLYFTDSVANTYQVTNSAVVIDSLCIDPHAALTSIDAEEKLLAFPNPATNTLTIKNITRQTVIRLYDALGKLVIEKEIESNTTFDISNLTQGVYTLIAEDGKGKAFNKVLITK